MFTKIDADNSGELDVQEFMKGCQEDQVKVDTLIAVVGRENAVSLKKVAYSILVGTTSSSCLLIISSINHSYFHFFGNPVAIIYYIASRSLSLPFLVTRKLRQNQMLARFPYCNHAKARNCCKILKSKLFQMYLSTILQLWSKKLAN